ISDLHAHKAREKVIHILKERGFLTKSEDHKQAIGKCYRCRTVIEPYLSPQWYVKVKPLAGEAMKAVEQGKTKIIPQEWENTYFEWMRNIKDWCISRQLWWGHQIPAWYCLKCNKDEIKGSGVKGQGSREKFISVKAKPIVSRDEPNECPVCRSKEIIRDNDVLDTWFSSALWPFSTLGWPDVNKKELFRYYPTSALVTGFDIIFFWVARMMMMGLKFMNAAPFKDVYIHALVRDAEGQKMSKSKGNVIDPLVIMDKYGTDAFRFTLAAMAAQGRDVKLAEERIEGYRNFCNKIWNLARFTLMNLGDSYQPSAISYQLSLADKWILTRLNAAIKETTSALENYRFNDAANSAYQFVWHELCDWYVELIKLDLRGEDGEERKKTAQYVLLKVLKDSLKLLHPIMPFITEEIWDVLPQESEVRSQKSEVGRAAPASIMRQPFPEAGEDYPDDEREMTRVMDVIKAIRNIRSEMNVAPAAQIEAICLCADDAAGRLLTAGEKYIKGLAKVSHLKIQADKTNLTRPEDAAVAVAGNIEIFVPLKGLINFDEEAKRLARDIEKTEKEIEGLKKRLSSADFIERAPKEVVEKDKARVLELMQKKVKLEEGLERIKRGKGGK
ncbi:MAG: valine--tRNA ligase, partial [Deltaproteobacteria bacterium]|nr:valine--tRNA ligase [Deltaproteobacteria bacterium]